MNEDIIVDIITCLLNETKPNGCLCSIRLKMKTKQRREAGEKEIHRCALALPGLAILLGGNILHILF